MAEDPEFRRRRKKSKGFVRKGERAEYSDKMVRVRPAKPAPAPTPERGPSQVERIADLLALSGKADSISYQDIADFLGRPEGQTRAPVVGPMHGPDPIHDAEPVLPVHEAQPWMDPAWHQAIGPYPAPPQENPRRVATPYRTGKLDPRVEAEDERLMRERMDRQDKLRLMRGQRPLSEPPAHPDTRPFGQLLGEPNEDTSYLGRWDPKRRITTGYPQGPSPATLDYLKDDADRAAWVRWLNGGAKK